MSGVARVAGRGLALRRSGWEGLEAIPGSAPRRPLAIQAVPLRCSASAAQARGAFASWPSRRWASCLLICALPSPGLHALPPGASAHSSFLSSRSAPGCVLHAASMSADISGPPAPCIVHSPRPRPTGPASGPRRRAGASSARARGLSRLLGASCPRLYGPTVPGRPGRQQASRTLLLPGPSKLLGRPARVYWPPVVGGQGLCSARRMGSRSPTPLRFHVIPAAL